MNELTHKFEELPVFTELGFEFGALNGEAIIRYSDDGEWSVGEIKLEGSRARKVAGRPTYETKLFPLCEKSHRELFLSIVDHLERGKRADSIRDDVIEALEQDGVLLRSDFAAHNTRHAALSGV